jgi:hypothetical protein
MKTVALLITLWLVAGCHRSPVPAPVPPASPKPESVNVIPSPKNVPPPVQALSYDSGYQAGDAAGFAAAKNIRAQHPKHPLTAPSQEELDVAALQAAGSDATRAQKWQRGYADGYRDGFQSVAERKR